MLRFTLPNGRIHDTDRPAEEIIISQIRAFAYVQSCVLDKYIKAITRRDRIDSVICASVWFYAGYLVFKVTA